MLKRQSHDIRRRKKNEKIHVSKNIVSVVDLGKFSAKVPKSDFQILKVIGRGSFGKVYLVNYIANN